MRVMTLMPAFSDAFFYLMMDFGAYWLCHFIAGRRRRQSKFMGHRVTTLPAYIALAQESFTAMAIPRKIIRYFDIWHTSHAHYRHASLLDF